MQTKQTHDLTRSLRWHAGQNGEPVGDSTRSDFLFLHAHLPAVYEFAEATVNHSFSIHGKPMIRPNKRLVNPIRMEVAPIGIIMSDPTEKHLAQINLSQDQFGQRVLVDESASNAVCQLSRTSCEPTVRDDGAGVAFVVCHPRVSLLDGTVRNAVSVSFDLDCNPLSTVAHEQVHTLVTSHASGFD